MNEKLDKYSYFFIKHIAKFCNTHKLLESDKIVIGVSGGHDSMSLLHICYLLKKYKLIDCAIRAVSINHGTRLEIDNEQEIIKHFCESLDIDFTSLKVEDLSLADSNFEMRARESRYRLLNSFLEEGELCLLAHHLDDCFEWSLMQSLKSSSIKKMLGIPVKRARFRRPLLCISRKQLEKYSKKNGIPYVIDNSNEDTRFERNYIRSKIVSNIQNRFPKYLKHYVARQQQMHELFKFEARKKMSLEIYTRDWGKILKTSGNLSLDDIRDIVERSSDKNRGMLQKQLENFVNNFNSNNIKRGPYTFSGGLILYNFRPYVLLCYKGSSIRLSTAQISDHIPFISKVDSKKKAIKNALNPFKDDMNELLEQGILFNYSWTASNDDILLYL